MLQFGLRLGALPRNLMTTMPRPVPLIRGLLADPRTVVSPARTQDNANRGWSPGQQSRIQGVCVGMPRRTDETSIPHRRPHERNFRPLRRCRTGCAICVREGWSRRTIGTLFPGSPYWMRSHLLRA